MSFKKEKPSADESSLSMAPLNFPNKVLGKVNPVKPEMTTDLPAEVDVDVDMREVYFLIMHFLSAGPCKRTYGQLWNELLEHQLLPRRYHAWYSRSGARSGNEDDDGMSLPLCYLKLVERYCDKRIQPSGQELVSPSSCIRRKESVDKERNTSLQPKDILCTHQWNAGEASIYEHVSISCSARVPEDASASHSSNRKDIYFHHPQFGLISVPVPVGAVPHQSLGAGYGSILQPMLYSKTSFPSHNLPAVEKTVQIPDQSNSDDHNVINQSQCNEFHHHEENHQNPHSKQKVDREPGVSTDISCAPMEQLTRSASCSENVNKDSRSNGSGETVGATRVTGAALENGNESGVQEGNINRSNCGRSRREAALIKFCLKRKDRCFEKKVRYHSRKMLAEQRPRVKGQFVRQKVSESTAPKDVED